LLKLLAAFLHPREKNSLKNSRVKERYRYVNITECTNYFTYFTLRYPSASDVKLTHQREGVLGNVSWATWIRNADNSSFSIFLS